MIVAALGIVLASPAQARLTRLLIESRGTLAPARPGTAPYVLLKGRFEGDVAPSDPHDRVITDLRFAPRNRRGRVPYVATFAIALPVDAGRESGVLFYQVPNRGNGQVAADPDGHVRVVSGWQGDIPTSGESRG